MRPALVAATRLFLVAGVALVLVDETGELREAVAAGDLAQVLEDAAPQLWSGPSLEVLASGEPVRTADLPGDGRWPALAAPARAGRGQQPPVRPGRGRGPVPPAPSPRSGAPAGPGWPRRSSRCTSTPAWSPP